MDGQKFDTLTRALAGGTSRRSLLKLFGGATVAGVAGVTVARPLGVVAQDDCPGDGTPGSCCFSADDCDTEFCVIQGDVGAAGICACTSSGLGEPWLGCGCTTGTMDPCGDSNLLCCATGDTDGGPGICGESCDAPEGCSELQTMCEDTNCCAEGTTCGANGWCNGCYSGTEDPCGPYNEAFGADYICCTFGNAADGAVGYCVAQDECVVAPPNTGSGSTAGDVSSWIAPAAVVGAAAVALAYKNRGRAGEIDA